MYENPTFYLTVYDSPLSDLALRFDILFSYRIHDGTFSTKIDGGFYTASVSFTMPYSFTRHVYKRISGKAAILFDELGNRVFEGKVKKQIVDGTTLTVVLVGFFSHTKDLLCGLIYPTSTATSISDVIEDVIDLGEQWDSTKLFVHQTTVDITPQDFSGELKLNDAVEGVLKYGSDDSPPRRMHFQVWDYRSCHLVVEKDIETDEPDWYASVLPIKGALTTTLSIENIVNKIQVIYDDPNLDGPDFTSWEHDTDSQDNYGVIEGSYSLGESSAALAGLVAEMLLTKYGKPEQSFTLNINNKTGYIRGSGGKPSYRIRAGDIVRIDSVDTSVDFETSNNPGKSLAQAIVFGTSYNIKSKAMSITLGTKAATFDFLMTRLGYSVGSMK